ncbi:excinuclease ABC subunit B [bacterium]|nr:excinuclease ABC subunit B [bacterium]
MLCSLCKKNEATIHYTEVVNNQVKKIDICDQCAKSKGINIELPFSFSDILTALSKEITGLEPAAKGRRAPSCQVCKMRLNEFLKSGRLGCAHCYETFADTLQDIMRNIQKGVTHMGKVPARFFDAESTRRRISQIEKELREAVAQERYEECVHLRDELKRLKEAKDTRNAQDAKEARDAKPKADNA